RTGRLGPPGESGRSRCDAPPGHAARANAPIRTEQGERGQADVPANAVEDNVYLARSLTGPQRPVPAAVVDDHVGPESARRRELALAAGQRDDARAGVAGKLDQKRSHSPPPCLAH